MIAYQNNDIGSSTTPIEILKNRDNFLANLVTNGLTLKSVLETTARDGKEIMYVLVQTPVELLLHIAEKLKLKLPIEENDLYRENVDTVFHKFQCFMPDDIELKTSYRNYFTAPYSTSLHNKFSHFFTNRDGHIDDIPKKDRCLIAYEILSRTTFAKKNDPSTTIFTDQCDDMKIGIELMVANGSFLAAYPLHEVNRTSLMIFENLIENCDFWINSV